MKLAVALSANLGMKGGSNHLLLPRMSRFSVAKYI